MNKDNEWQQFFDGHAPDYMDNVFTKNTLAEVDFIIEELVLDDGCRLLDVGCGTGRHSVELARRGYLVTGLDLSEGMLNQARKAARQAEVQVDWIQSDATAFEFNGEFDAAICLCEGAFGLLGSGDDPTAHDLAILRNIHRALKPKGGFLLTALNGFRLVRMYGNDDVAGGRLDPVYMTEKSTMEYRSDGENRSIEVTERGFAPSELMLMYRLAGFEIEHIGGGTAGNWGRRPIDLDEYELMVIAHRT